MSADWGELIHEVDAPTVSQPAQVIESSVARAQRLAAEAYDDPTGKLSLPKKCARCSDPFFASTSQKCCEVCRFDKVVYEFGTIEHVAELVQALLNRRSA